MSSDITDIRGDLGEDADDILKSLDVRISRLLDPTRSQFVRKKAENERKSLSNKEWRRLRVRTKRDLFFLCTGVLGYNRLSIGLHGHLCSHVFASCVHRFRNYLLPRFHFKSTILTIAHSIQLALPYTEEDYEQALDDGLDWMPEWPANLGVDIRLMIGHETATGAARFLSSIQSHFLSNSTLQMLFPECIPSYKQQTINKWELELPRNANHPEPTFDTMGVGAKSQGRHYNYIKLDDIYGRKARESVVESQTCIEWVDSIQMFFDTFTKDKVDFIGTRYKYDDVYGHIKEVYGDKLVYYRRSVTEPDENGIESPIFPEEITIESLEILKKNKKEYNAQMLNDPDRLGEGFDTSYKRHFYWISKWQLVFFARSPFSTQNMKESRDIRDMDICCLIDPGLGKTGGFAITGMDYQQKVFVLEAISLEGYNHPKMIELAFEMWFKYHFRCLAIESDTFMSAYEHWFKMEMPRRGISFIIEPVKTLQRTKDERIRGLSTYMEAEQFYYNETQSELDKELDRFGKTHDIHILDALAYGPEVWIPGMMPGMREKYSDYSENSDDYLEDVDPVTGYSMM